MSVEPNLTCRVCGSTSLQDVLEFPAPSITSIATLFDTVTSVKACPLCSHIQSADLPLASAFYNTTYRISLNSNTHDQMLTGKDGRPAFRTELQAKVTHDMLVLGQGSRILDYGAAKANTLRCLKQLRPDLDAYAYDVSADYHAYWINWLAADHCATYDIPDAWKYSFDAITLYFVLEHVIDIYDTLETLSGLLATDGRVFLTVPHFESNPVDLIVVDHVNHFTEASLDHAFRIAGFTKVAASANVELPNAIAAVYSRGSSDCSSINANVSNVPVLQTTRDFWISARERVITMALSRPMTPAAIFGAGVYGTWISCILQGRANVVSFLDNNPHFNGTIKSGIPVMLPSQVPAEVEIVYVGLNPAHARDVVEASGLLDRDGLTFVWL